MYYKQATGDDRYMKVLVTGGAGFIGSHIVDKLVEQSFDVVVIDNLSTGKKENVHPNARFYLMDVTSSDIQKVFDIERPEYVIHHSAQIDVQRSLRDPMFDAKVNIIGTINILENCKLYGVKKIVYASSAAVYGDPEFPGVNEQQQIEPLSFYGISKHTPEHYIKTYSKLNGFNYTILRYSNVYGTRQDWKGEGGVISIFLNKLLNHERPVIYGDGEQTRDFIYVTDVANANIAALLKGDNQIINISHNDQTSINELVRIMSVLMHTDLPPVYLDARPGDILRSYLDNAKALELLEWQPQYTLMDGLSEMIDSSRKKELTKTNLVKNKAAHNLDFLPTQLHS